MRYSIRRAITVVALAVLAGGIPALSHGGVLRALPAAAGTTQYCPPNPTPGTTINGNLLVTGMCELDSVTLTGSIAMTPKSSLVLRDSKIGGNISGQNVQFVSFSSSIRGNINITSAFLRDGQQLLTGSTSAIYHSLVTGNVYGSFTNLRACDSTVRGSINYQDSTVTIGDPNDIVGCTGNTIGGGIILKSAEDSEIENNTIGGSVYISNGIAMELASNTIAGSATCSNVTFFSDGDAASNTTKGSNTC